MSNPVELHQLDKIDGAVVTEVCRDTLLAFGAQEFAQIYPLFFKNKGYNANKSVKTPKMTRPLYRDIPPSLATAFGNIDGQVKAGAPVFVGSPGSIATKTNQQGLQFFVRRFYNGAGVQQEEYLGTVKDNAATIEFIESQIKEAKSIVSELRMLVREGFQYADAKTYATLATLHSNELFKAGATLIGSHAFGVLLNQIGVYAEAYRTDDIDVARPANLAFAVTPDKGLLEMLKGSGIDFVEVPALDHKDPPVSFKQAGVSRFKVDLLVPSSDDVIRTVAVPELQAHATALPYLAYLLGQTQMGTIISREGACPVRVPTPERFAIHKLLVSQIRTNRDAKSEKDIDQACILIAATGDKFPGAIEDATLSLPISARKHLKTTSPIVIDRLAGHPRAMEEFKSAMEANSRRRG